MPSTNQLIGAQIKRARQLANLTQDQLGEKIFKTGAAVGYIERGQRGLVVEDIVEIARILNVPVEFFFYHQPSSNQLLQLTLNQLQTNLAGLKADLDLQANNIEQLIESLPVDEDFGLLIQAGSDPIVLLSLDLTLLYATPGIKGLLGYSSSELGGTHLKSMVVPEELASIKSKLRQVINNRRTRTIETFLLNVRSQVVPVEITFQVVSLESRSVIQGIVHRLSRRR
ncbi:MAG: hypothetical protein COU69_03170 [Candidatus Pacebacteria bacterium CG10_big_fil_rev_8_21_14_0_10_56_10]|nr:MAG: hypothetical protein COU69_03170 [Candidatus Pacebacteria bacterium CG10_big_fil_rev_8_21_14_0_10_56_10]